MSRPSEEHQGPVIRDKRRIDPVTGEVKVPPGETPAQASTSAGTGGAESGGGRGGGQPGGGGPGRGPGGGKDDGGEAAKLQAKLDERTNDLQRLQAEFANYRKRVERDRLAVREQALANVLVELLPVLDDIGRARDHGELTGGFKSVGEALEVKLAKLGLERYGEKGEPFDPTVHEALLHSYSTEVGEPTCVEILQPGYRVGGRVLRPARVSVAEPGEPPAQETDATADAEGAGGGSGTATAPDGQRPSSADAEASGGPGAGPGADTGENGKSGGSGGPRGEQDERD